jgi:hypothetical protein
MLFVQFETGQENRLSERFGPYPFVQLTYTDLRVGEDGSDTLAKFEDGWWYTADGERWSDVVIAP